MRVLWDSVRKRSSGALVRFLAPSWHHQRAERTHCYCGCRGGGGVPGSGWAQHSPILPNCDTAQLLALELCHYSPHEELGGILQITLEASVVWFGTEQGSRRWIFCSPSQPSSWQPFFLTQRHPGSSTNSCPFQGQPLGSLTQNPSFGAMGCLVQLKGLTTQQQQHLGWGRQTPLPAPSRP